MIIPTVGRVTSAIEDLETELQLYISAHDMVSGEGKLDEDKLNQQINTKKAMKLAVDRAIEVTKLLAKSNSAVNVLDSLLNVQFRLGSMSNEYAENIKELEEKLEKLHQFSSSTSGLFNESLTAMKIAMQSVIVLNKTLVKSDGSYVLPVGIDRSWFTETKEVSNTEFEKLKKKIADDDLPATKAEILRDYYWSTNSNQYVSRKTGKPSEEVTALYNKLVMAEHQPQKNPELEFYNEMLRTGKHPITGEDISDAERVNAKIMMYGLALQPFVGAWAMSRVPKSYETGVDKKVSGLKFGNSEKLEAHFSKHGGEFGSTFSSVDEYLAGANDVINKGIKVQYNYKGEVRTGYVQFMKNSSLTNANGVPIKSYAKFEFVGTNNLGEITTYHVESGKTFWKMMNDGKNIPVINPIE